MLTQSMAQFSGRSMLKGGALPILGALSAISLPALFEAIQNQSTPCQRIKLKITDMRDAQVIVRGPQMHQWISHSAGQARPWRGDGRGSGQQVSAAQIKSVSRRSGHLEQEPVSQDSGYEDTRTERAVGVSLWRMRLV